MKSGSAAVAMAVAMVMMSAGEAALWNGCPYLCADICGGATDRFCNAACERQFCILSPTPAPTPAPTRTPAGEDDSDLWVDCTFLCAKVCGGLEDKVCTAACKKLYCIVPPAPPTAQPELPGDI